MSRKVIKASHLVLGTSPITISTRWSTSGWNDVAAAEECEEPEVPEGSEEASKMSDRGEAGEGPGEAAGPGEARPETEEIGVWEAEAHQRAGAIVQKAEEEAARLVEEARTRAAALLEEAQREGYQAGFQDGVERGLVEGRAKAEAEMEAAVKQTMKVLAAAVCEKGRIVASSRDDVLKLVRKVAEKIIRTEIRLDPSVVERAIDASLRLVTERGQVLVRVNPEDLTRAREGLPHFLQYFTPSAVLEVCGDPRVARGGCLIETSGGNIDARLETELEEAFGKLEEGLHGG